MIKKLLSRLRRPHYAPTVTFQCACGRTIVIDYEKGLVTCA